MFKPVGYEENADRWDQLYDAMNRGYAVEGVVRRVTYPSGIPTWILDLGEGIKGMVPDSHTGLEDVNLMDRFMWQKVLVKVIGFDKDNMIVACSRKEAIADATEKFFEQAKVDMVIPAVVKAILPRSKDKPERLQVEIGGGILVEIPRKEATKSEVFRLVEIFQPRASVQVRIIQVDKQTNTVKVSLLDEKDPWDGFEVKRGDFLAGRVVGVRKVNDNKLVFVEVEPGITGIANLPVRGSLGRGDLVAVAVASFDPDKKKLHLRIRGGKLA